VKRAEGGTGELPTLKALVVLAPAHIDPTCNLHEKMFVVEGELAGGWEVVDEWEIAGRGPGW